MPKYKGEVSKTRVWGDVEVEAEDEDEAGKKLEAMTDTALDEATTADETVEVDFIECIEDCPEEEE